MRWVLQTVVFGASVLLAAGVRAQAGLKLDTSACAAAWASGLERFVAIELGGAQALEIAVRCEGERVAIEVGRGASRSERQMDLKGTAEAVRSRVVALAVAGLVRELEVIGEGQKGQSEHEHEPVSEDEPERVDEPERADADADVDVDVDEDARAHAGDDADDDVEDETKERWVELDLFFSPSVFSATAAIVWGGGVRVQYLGPGALRVALDAQAGTYTRDTTLGDARLVSGSLGARLAWTRAFAASTVGVGVGQRVGLARASARTDAIAASDAAVSGMWAGPFAFGWLDFALADRLRLGVDVEAGIVLLPVRGRIERDDDVAVDGAWLALSLVLGAQL